jgi:hypothetical protein
MFGKLLQAAMITFLLSAIVEMQTPVGNTKPIVTPASAKINLYNFMSPSGLALTETSPQLAF